MRIGDDPAPAKERLDDLQVYRLLIDEAAQLETAATSCWSTGAATALAAASRVIRTLASAIYKASLSR
jgi:hypothetical protein